MDKTYKFCYVNNMHGVAGDVMSDLYVIPLFDDLQPGEQVQIIGRFNPKGGETSSHRILHPVKPLTYVGQIRLEDDEEKGAIVSRALFISDREDVLEQAGMPVYLAFIVMDDIKELWMPLDKLQNLFTYKGYYRVGEQLPPPRPKKR